jgi:hypothetical protein
MRKPNLSYLNNRIGYTPTHECESIPIPSGSWDIGQPLIGRDDVLRQAMYLLDHWTGDAFGTEEDRKMITASSRGMTEMHRVWSRVENDFASVNEWYYKLLADVLAGLSDHLPFGMEVEETHYGVEIVVKDHACNGEVCETEFIEYPACKCNAQHERDGVPAMYRAMFNPGGTNSTTYEYACADCAQGHGIARCKEYKSY